MDGLRVQHQVLGEKQTGGLTQHHCQVEVRAAYQTVPGFEPLLSYEERAGMANVSQ